MCCLFGFVDYGHKLTRKQRMRLLYTLSNSAEDRGTDATGIAYNHEGKQIIYKRPLPAHLMWYRVPFSATTVMGHTRMTTQGSEKQNWNNHPFPGKAGDSHFALAHNGVLFNDKHLRKQYKLPVTKVETDSFVAVQMLERYGEVNFDALRFMAEALEGTFTITALTERDELYFIKGNNPLTIHHYPQYGLYIYASTDAILQNGISRSGLRLGRMEPVYTFTGDLLRIDARGKITRREFRNDSLLFGYGTCWYDWQQYKAPRRSYTCAESSNTQASCFLDEADYIEDLKAVASCHGVYPEDIDAMLAGGISLEEIEEYLYCG